MLAKLALWVFAVAAALCASRNVAAATDAPPCNPTPSPTPSATPRPYVRFVEAGLLPGERTRTTMGLNRSGPMTNRLRAAAEYRFLGDNFVEIDYRRWKPSFTDQDVIVNSSVVGQRRVYLATSTLIHSTSAGTPDLHGDFGFGLEALPDLSRPAGVYLSYYYYPEVAGRVAATGRNARYKTETYSVGATLAVPRTPLFIDAGIAGDHYLRKENVTADITHFSATAAVGIRL